MLCFLRCCNTKITSQVADCWAVLSIFFLICLSPSLCACSSACNSYVLHIWPPSQTFQCASIFTVHTPHSGCDWLVGPGRLKTWQCCAAAKVVFLRMCVERLVFLSLPSSDFTHNCLLHVRWGFSRRVCTYVQDPKTCTNFLRSRLAVARVD